EKCGRTLNTEHCLLAPIRLVPSLLSRTISARHTNVARRYGWTKGNAARNPTPLVATRGDRAKSARHAHPDPYPRRHVPDPLHGRVSAHSHPGHQHVSHLQRGTHQLRQPPRLPLSRTASRGHRFDPIFGISCYAHETHHRSARRKY